MGDREREKETEVRYRERKRRERGREGKEGRREEGGGRERESEGGRCPALPCLARSAPVRDPKILQRSFQGSFRGAYNDFIRGVKAQNPKTAANVVPL